MSVTPSTGEIHTGIKLAALGAENKAVSGVEKGAAQAAVERRNNAGKTAEETFQGWFDKLAVGPNIDKNVDPGARKDRANTAEGQTREIAGRKLADIFVDTSPEGMAQQKMLREGAMAALDRVADGNILKSLIDNEPNQAAKDALLDGALLALNEHGDITRAVQAARRELIEKYKNREKSTEYTDAETAVTTKEAEQAANVAAIKKNTTDIGNVATALKSFEDKSGATPPGVKGAKFIDLENANADLNAFLTKIPGIVDRTSTDLRGIFDHRDTLDQRLAVLNDQIRDIQAMEPPPAADSPNDKSLADALSARTRLFGDRVIAVNYGAQYDTEKASVAVLENERVELKGKETALKTQAEDLKGDKSRLKAELTEAQKKLDSAREAFEEPYVKEWEDVVATAMEKVYLANLNRGEAEADAIRKELIAKETDPVAKAVYELIDDGRWAKIDEVRMAKVRGALSRNAKFIGDHEVIKFDDVMIKADAGVLINKGEQEFMAPLIEAYISGSDDPEITSITDPTLRAAAIKAKAEEIYKSEKFQNEVVPRVTKELLGRALQRGLLKPADVRKIEATPEGKRLLEEAKTTHADWIEQQKKSMRFVGSTAEFFKKHPKFGMWLLLTMMFPVVGFGVGAFVLSKGIVGNPLAGHGAAEHPKKEEAPTRAPAPALNLEPAT